MRSPNGSVGGRPFGYSHNGPERGEEGEEMENVSERIDAESDYGDSPNNRRFGPPPPPPPPPPPFESREGSPESTNSNGRQQLQVVSVGVLNVQHDVSGMPLAGRDGTPRSVPQSELTKRKMQGEAQLRYEYYNRPRLTVTSRPRIVAAPMLDRSDWNQPLFTLCFCLYGNERPEAPLDDEFNSPESSVTPRRKHYPHSPSNSGNSSILGHFCWRMFCLRCSVADQMRLLAIEEDERGYEPLNFCCEGFFGSRMSLPRAFWTMCICDILTGGSPCGCFYHGLGTALYGCRLRYLVRCRYRLQGIVLSDFIHMLCCPLLSVDQQGAEMLANGLVEPREFGKFML
ncbi:hypothetical protein, conserved [Trypanosoma brucei brucei TREU927]|uniref:PLAC8 family protein n=1 Tax=Trypanosoma brucei brucei (strain 927/4 GUTat10.1) TaxID=185431 RepID=Q582C6_TRYB2|nr:hypothetical protein, conserved [Trypanosoma brucei brucei TREU927]AAX80443.1 hypothetical protein, conserved [Trypanosoma brucei]AAZ11354.1 hypothetical protein, conserved [Trypanosoma brucei brucei TREU927]